MLMPPFELHRPGTVEEACKIAAELLEANKSLIDSCGTDLIPNYKWHINTKPHVISLSGIEEAADFNSEIGCMARLHDIAQSDQVHPPFEETRLHPHLLEEMQHWVERCLDTRCFWFNQTEEWQQH